MKKLLMAAIICCGMAVVAQEKTNFYFPNEEVTKVIEIYSKISGQKFIVDSTVRGKVTILNPSPVTADEAFNQLSEALSLQGYAIVKNGDVYTVRNARSAQRDNVQVTTDVPAPKPQRMVTWIISLKHALAHNIGRDLRLLTSSYGEMSVNYDRNQIIITDWASNLQRVGEVINQVDKPLDAATAKLVAAAKKENKERVEIKVKKKDTDSDESEPAKSKN